MNDQELRQAMQRLESINQQLENVNRQARILQNTRDETARAGRTVQALSEAKPGDEVLVPIGGSCFVTVQVSETKKAVVGIGSKVSVEKTFDEAIEHLNSEVKELNTAIEQTIAAMQEIQQYSDKVSASIEAEYRQRRQQGLPPQQ